MTNLIELLLERLKDSQLVCGEALSERVVSFWDASPTQAKVLVFARSTADVSYVLRVCHALEQSVITQGGLTGCVEGAVSSAADVILSLEKMNVIESIDEVGATATVQAGAVLQRVQESVAEKGLLFPLDLGARGSCTIGGNVATNAGGINVIRYGMMRNLVLGLEAVLADGTIVRSMNHMLKNNAGYDLKQLFIGSEGTLGVVTRVVLRLFPQSRSSNAALVALNDFASVAALLQQLQASLGGTLSAFEVMWGSYFHAVTEPDWHRAPMSREHPFYVMLQSDGGNPEGDKVAFDNVLEQALESGQIVDAVIPKSEEERRELWNIREDFEAILSPKPVYLHDVSLPIKDMDAYVKLVLDGVQARWPQGRCYVLGHIGDGNIHFFTAPMQKGGWHEEVDGVVYAPLAQFGGSVSAEHGIGNEKLEWLRRSRSLEELGVMYSLKKALDPKNILNPGIVLA
ncbi:MAG: FAD/FMN-containing dehydrogenase [Litorivivens sp.]|jgi:FAD/FMN-containing dehydrogenase